MKLVHPDLKVNFDFTEGKVNVWVIENPAAFYQYIRRLSSQINGREGKFVLSHDGKVLKIAKQMEIILEPWSLDFANRKILGRLYEEIKEVAWESESFMRTKEILSGISQYILELEQRLPYAIVCPDEIDFVQFLKGLDIKLEIDGETILERLVLYIKLCRRLLHIQILTLVNIKCCLTKKELQELYHVAAYEKVFLLLIEGYESEKMECETKYIMDKGMCEIFA